MNIFILNNSVRKSVLYMKVYQLEEEEKIKILMQKEEIKMFLFVPVGI